MKNKIFFPPRYSLYNIVKLLSVIIRVFYFTMLLLLLNLLLTVEGDKFMF